MHLLSVVEEECTGNGALQCLISGLHADGCVLTEPHYGHITTAQVGVLWFSVEVTGVAAHAGHAELGANAIDGVWTTDRRAARARVRAQPGTHRRHLTASSIRSTSTSA